MPIIQCTEKLRKEMGLKDSSLSEVQAGEQSLSSWHANLIYIAGKKCVLFVNDKTRLNFIVPDASRDDIRRLGNIFLETLYPVLAQEGFTEAQCKKIACDGEPVLFSKTSSKSVIGSINDFAAHYECRILDAGSLHSPEIPVIISKLNHMPVNAINFALPVEVMRAEIESET